MKKTYMTPELEAIKISTVCMLAGSLKKQTEGVDDESEVLAPVFDNF